MAFWFVLSLLLLSYSFSFHFWGLPFLPISPFLPNNELFSRQFLYEENRAVISTVAGKIEKTFLVALKNSVGLERDCFGAGGIKCVEKRASQGGWRTTHCEACSRATGAAKLAPLVEVSRILPDVGCPWRVSGHGAVSQEARRKGLHGALLSG